MATPLVNGDILRITIACRIPTKSQNGLSDIHYRVKSAGGQTLEYIPNFLYNRWVTQYRLWLPSVASFAGISASREVGAAKAGPFYYVFPTAGQLSADVLPLQVSGLIRKTSPGNPAVVPVLGSGTGRVYVPFPATVSYVGSTGILSDAGLQRLASIQAALGPTILIPSGGELTMVLRRTETRPDPLPPLLLGYSDVSQMTSLKALATQRRRGDFGRINAAFGGIL